MRPYRARRGYGIGVPAPVVVYLCHENTNPCLRVRGRVRNGGRPAGRLARLERRRAAGPRRPETLRDPPPRGLERHGLRCEGGLELPRPEDRHRDVRHRGRQDRLRGGARDPRRNGRPPRRARRHRRVSPRPDTRVARPLAYAEGRRRRRPRLVRRLRQVRHAPEGVQRPEDVRLFRRRHLLHVRKPRHRTPRHAHLPRPPRPSRSRTPPPDAPSRSPSPKRRT